MKPVSIPEMLIASVAILGAVGAILRFVFVPHFKELITETVEPWLREVPQLTIAVKELTQRMELMESAIPSLASTAAAAAEVVSAAAQSSKASAEAASLAAAAVLETAKHAAASRKRGRRVMT